MKVTRTLFALGAILGAVASPVLAADAALTLDGLREQAQAVLDVALVTEKGWVRVHAAEAQIALGNGGQIRSLFKERLAAAEASPFRVGTWRVLATTAVSPEEREGWIRRIEAVFLNPASADRLQAIESLAKLRHVVTGETLVTAQKLAATTPSSAAVLSLWALALANEPHALDSLAGMLASSDAEARMNAAYTLRWLRPTDPALLQKVARATDAEPVDSIAYPYLLGAALQTKSDPARSDAWHAALLHVLLTGSMDARFEAAQTLQGHLTPADLPRLEPLLTSSEPDTRIGAALCVLRLFLDKPAR